MVTRACGGRTDTTRTLALMGAAIGLLHLLGWGLFAAAGPNRAFVLGVALTAYTLGMRHAFDADHIAAIDNTTRKLRGEGQEPLTVGLWFSLGHSTIVLVLACALALAAGRMHIAIAGPASWLHGVGGPVGALVSTMFLYTIAALNLQGLRDTLRRRGDLTRSPNLGGPLFRIFGRVVRRIRRPSGMYPVGVLFGLGFDTATEIALLATTVGAAMGPLPWYDILSLPCLFAAGMSLCDSIDGVSMRFAYDWSLLRPARRRLWNICVTGLSVGVAFGVGTIELLGLASGWSRRVAHVLAPLAHLDLTRLGFSVAVTLIALWLLALLLWRERGRGRRGPVRHGAAQSGDAAARDL